MVEYEGDARIDGVPGTAAAIPIEFLDVAGSSCGSLLPTGSVVDTIDGVEVTCIDNGMPVVVMRARSRRRRRETPEQLEANVALKARVEKIRLQSGPRMNLGDVARRPCRRCAWYRSPRHGGAIRRARSFRIACTKRSACWAQ